MFFFSDRFSACGLNRQKPRSRRAGGSKSGSKRSTLRRRKASSTSISGAARRSWTQGIFQAAFPEIKVTGVTGRGPQLLQRILSERRGEKYLADVYIDGLGNIYPAYNAKVLDPIKPTLILPAVVDATKWWQGKHHYTDPEDRYIFRFQSTAMKGMISYNTSLVNPKSLKSFWDLLQPQWKGKIEVRDIREAGPGSAGIRFFYHNAELGPNFIRRLIGEMDDHALSRRPAGDGLARQRQVRVVLFLQRYRRGEAPGSAGRFLS